MMKHWTDVLREERGEPGHWTDRWITEREEYGEKVYYGWDERRVDVVYVSKDRSQVVNALINYEKQLNARRKAEKGELQVF